MNKDAILVRPGSITTSTTWRTSTIPYVLESGTLNVGGGAAPVWTIEPGVTVKLGTRVDVTVNYTAPATVHAIGSAEAPILFTANGAAVPGFWLALYLGNNTGAASRMEHVIVEYGGSASPWRGAVHVAGKSPEFENVTFRNNLTAGLAIEAGSPVVTNCAFAANTGAGLDVVGGAVSLSDATFTANTAYALRLAQESS